MNQAQIQQVVIDYLNKITGFAYLNTKSKQDADDLTHDIALELIKSLTSQQAEINNLPAYIYRISKNVLFQKIRRSKRASYVELTGHEYEDDHCLDAYLSDEEIASLRREISFLSSNYRDIIVQYYYENRSIHDIAKHSGIPTGTVKWWLFEARKQIKKGIDIMRPNGEKSFNPEKLHLAISGSPGIDGSPTSLVNENLLTQNMLIAAYKKPQTEEELALELGVARPYIESEIRKLAAAELLKESNGAYQTDFVISDDSMALTNQLLLEDYYDQIKERVLDFINDKWDFFVDPRVNVAKFERNRILWVAVPLITDLIRRTTNHKIIQRQSAPQRPSGGKWIALGMQVGKRFQFSNGFQPDRYGYNGTISSYFNDNTYGQRVLFHQFSGYTHPEFEQEVIQEAQEKHNQIVLLCIKATHQPLDVATLAGHEKDYAAEAIKHGLLLRESDYLKPNFMFIPKGDLELIKKSCEALGDSLLPLLKEILEKITANIKSSAPKAVWYQIGTFADAYFGCLTPMVLDDLYRSGNLSEPQEHDRHLLSYYLWSNRGY